MGDHLVDVAVAGDGELEADAGTGAAADCPEPSRRSPGGGRAQAAQLVRRTWSAFSAMSSPNHFACS